MTDAPSSPADSSGLPVAYRQGNAFEGLLPIIGYMAGNQVGSRLFSDTAGDRLAILAMTLAAGFAVVRRHRRGRAIGWWIPSVAVYFLVRGAAGLVFGEKVFLSFGIGLKVALGLAAPVSVFVGRPLAAELSPLILPLTEQVR